jgi:polar amino acid transport system substrate-binding protein
MMHFKSLLFVVLTTILLTAPSTWAAAPMIISGNPDSPPVSWDKNGKLMGVGPELATKILSELKTPFSLQVAGNWQQVQDKTRDGAVDMIVAAYKNKERQEYMDYSIPFMESPVVIVVKKGSKFPFSSWKSLIGKKGVAHSGESFGEKLDAFIKSDLDVNYLPYERAFQMLAEDTADYLIIDLYPAIIYSKLLQAENKVEFFDTPASIQHFHMTISKKSPYVKLLPEINKKIAEMQEQKYIKKLIVEQYKQWNESFQQRQRFFAKQKARAIHEQTSYNADTRDRGLEQLGRFIERDMPYMDGSNFD